MEKGYVTIKSAAEILGVSIETIRNWDKSGKLTAKRDDRNSYRLYKISELQKFSEKQNLRRTNGKWKLIGD
jgi:excisionase family DNA binding protein